MSTASTETTSGSRTSSSDTVARKGGDDPGSTHIADVVVQKIAGIATREIPGVHGLGGGAQRAFSAVRERIPGATTNVAEGVGVEVGEKEAAVDLEIMVEYGISISELAGAVRRNVISAVERMTSLHVIEVNVNVSDINLPDDGEDSSGTEARVQ